MPEPEIFQLLPKMIGETITTYCDPPDSAYYPPRDWIVIDKLDENSRLITQSDFASGMGPAFTAGKYLCRPSAGNENKLAFMHLTAGKFGKHRLLSHETMFELDALKDLTENKCTATPKLLGYRFDKQDGNDLAPGGYIMYLSLPFSRRQIIRDKFKKAYTKISGFSWADRIQPERQWKDYDFVKFTLVLISPKQDKKFPALASDLQDVQNNGWRW
ncbi:unnamed protein product [Penicillium palitans]